MRVLVLTPYLYGKAPGPRSSIELWERVLARAGIAFTYAPFESRRLHEILYQPGRQVEKALEMLRGVGRRIRETHRARDFDAVLVYREAALLGPEFFERWVARQGIPIVYQLDDPLYVPYRSPANGYLSYLKFVGKVGRIAQMSAITVVNSDQLREYAARYTNRIEQIPCLIDGDVFRPDRNPRPGSSDAVCVGWSGSITTAGNLREIHGPLRTLGERDDVRVHFIGTGLEELDLPGVRRTTQPWRAETEVDDLRQLDVGLIPLPVDGWTKRKFYLKSIQYSALGIPPVATPLGMNPKVIQDGRTGLLAATDREWTDGVARLVEDGELRAQMGAAAAQRVHDRYTLQANEEKIISVFTGLHRR
jgi:glycosyltransferase involved in cell wall biosynthesis